MDIMDEPSLTTSTYKTGQPELAPEGPASYLAEEYKHWQALMASQPAIIQRFLETQARALVDAIDQRATQARFTLPNHVVIDATPGGDNHHRQVTVPASEREQLAGGLMDRLTRADLTQVLRQRLAELEASPNQAVSTSAGLLRYALAYALVYNTLPSGRTVVYRAAPGDEIPSIPESPADELASAITASTDAIVESPDEAGSSQRGELLVPYVPAARRFYLPQWVVFDDDDHLLVKADSEAQANVASMQRFLKILHTAVALAPYMVTDADYQQKRYGMLGQLVNQARSLARFQTREIIATIQRRAAAHDLNRGLSLSLPYFDDQSLEMCTHFFEIIPAGRIMFVPAFVVRAAFQEQAKVAQDTRLSPSTRKHLLNELQMLENAFK
jgi:hypothetical protein